MQYLKDYNEILYDKVILLRNNYVPRKIRYGFFSRLLKPKLYICSAHKKSKQAISKLAAEFMGIGTDDIDSIAKEYLHKLRNMQKYITESDVKPFWTTELGREWLCLNLFTQLGFNLDFYRALLRSDKIHEGGEVYDYGCGCAALSLMLNDKFNFEKLTLSDLDNYASDFVKYYIQSTGKTNIEWENILNSDKNKKDDYDIVICLDVLEHLENSFSHFMHLHNKLKKNGILVLGIAFEGEDVTHLPQACEDFYIKNDGWTFLNENYQLYESIHYNISLISGIYIKK